jgi:hypothetical protein
MRRGTQRLFRRVSEKNGIYGKEDVYLWLRPHDKSAHESEDGNDPEFLEHV